MKDAKGHGSEKRGYTGAGLDERNSVVPVTVHLTDSEAAAALARGGGPKAAAVPVHPGASGRVTGGQGTIPIAPGGKAVQGGAVGFLGSLHNAPGVAKDKWGWSHHDYNGFRVSTNGTAYTANNPKTGRNVSLKRVTS